MPNESYSKCCIQLRLYYVIFFATNIMILNLFDELPKNDSKKVILKNIKT